MCLWLKDFFGVDQRVESYFGTVIRLTANNPTQVKWIDDKSVSVESVSLLKLDTEASPITTINNEKFQLRIKDLESCSNNNIDFIDTITADKESRSSTSGWFLTILIK